ncbi:TPA: hypothetical protein KRG84_001944 [Clostridioides difficile]|nr:hypothetical protein [Clostridioides difficile]EGT4160744.1 hypothetical protein [Clostridioides difficile]EGT4635058.1 hypothetical protein [Clostridioides difficile]EGT4831782.1 hypothetical protein [Clostridioides difficile]EII6777309.1 hypothetical protein [Clostridioides difficile]
MISQGLRLSWRILFKENIKVNNMKKFIYINEHRVYIRNLFKISAIYKENHYIREFKRECLSNNSLNAVIESSVRIGFGSK